ncbi:MAG: hypothetical protein K2K72_00770 [Duncaniella sp.]|nr:hypothetical protein [Duncaniella sp.]
MKSFRLHLLPVLLLTLISSLSLTSCHDEEDYLANNLLGQWGLASPFEGIIEFYDDGTGYCAYYDDLGEFFEEDFNYYASKSNLRITNWDCVYFPTGDYTVYWGPGAVTLTPQGGGVPIVLEP